MKAQFEKIITSIDSSFHAFLYENDNFDAHWHFHPEYELTYIVKGKGMRYVGNSVQKFEEGDFVLLGSNLPHCWKNTDHKKGNVKSIVFQWNDALLGENWLQKSEFKPIRKLLQNASKGIKFEKKFAEKKLSIISGILEKPPFEKLLCFVNLLGDLSIEPSVEYFTTADFSPNLNRKANNRIDKVYDFVRENYDKKIKLEDVSSIVSMGEEAFCRFFKKSLNKSFFTFVNEYRINLVCKSLIETNKSVSQIAYECGYESLPFFYRQFQKFMDCSPLVFKKMYLNALK